MSRAEALLAAGRPRWPEVRRLAVALAPSLLFALRLWAAVCLALYIAFALELDNASWAGTSAAIVCQPSLGASLRKGWFRLIGTTVGAVFIVLLTALFPQQRDAFLIGLALWGGACAMVTTLLRNFAVHGAVLAGLTAMVIGADELGAVGGANGQAFMIAVTRVSEIWIGIICAGVVLAATDFGGARRRLAIRLAGIAADIADGLVGAFAPDGPAEQLARPARRDLIRRVSALDPAIDEAVGEASDLHPRAPDLQAAVVGLFTALSGWRTVALYLEQLPDGLEHSEAALVQPHLPRVAAAGWLADPARVRQACTEAIRALVALPANTPSLRLLADRAAEAVIGIRHALDGLLLLVDPAHARHRTGAAPSYVPDLLPALVNGARAFLAIGAVELFWIVTAWPNGGQALVFAAIGVILFAPRADQAYGLAIGFLGGAVVAAVIAAIVEFAVLPYLVSFATFSLALGAVLVPGGMLMSLRPQVIFFLALTANFVPLLGPANQMNYDAAQFYNNALGIVGGVGVAALAFQLLPPVSPEWRARRLLTLTLREVRRLAEGPIPRAESDWDGSIFSRMSAMPEQAEPLQRAQLLAALSVGTEIIRLRRFARRLDREAGLAEAMNAIARGDVAAATSHLDVSGAWLAAAPPGSPAAVVGLRARGSIRAIQDALGHHAAYFAGAPEP